MNNLADAVLSYYLHLNVSADSLDPDLAMNLLGSLHHQITEKLSDDELLALQGAARRSLAFYANDRDRALLSDEKRQCLEYIANASWRSA